MEFAQFVENRGGEFHTYSSASRWARFHPFLHFTVVTAQNRQNLTFGFGGIIMKFVHEGLYMLWFDVRIPLGRHFANLWLSGTNLWFTFAPIQWLPRMYESEIKVECRTPGGHRLDFTFGREHKNLRCKRLSLIASRKSIASGWGSSRISLIVRSQSFSSPSSSAISPPSLYFQWAAKPCSATSSIRSLRIWTSIHLPCLLISVTCKAW